MNEVTQFEEAWHGSHEWIGLELCSETSGLPILKGIHEAENMSTQRENKFLHFEPETHRFQPSCHTAGSGVARYLVVYVREVVVIGEGSGGQAEVARQDKPQRSIWP